MGGRVHFAIPGDIETPTGGYGYDRRLIAELPGIGWQVEHVVLPDGFPDADRATLSETSAILESLPRDALVMVDGLAFAAMPELVQALSDRLRFVALVHHPLADETGLAPERVAKLAAAERRALALARQVICTSRTTAERLTTGFEVDPARLTIAPPGTDRRPMATGSEGAPVILSLAAVVPRKGHDVLIAALASLGRRDWTCRIVGSLDREHEWVGGIRDSIGRLGLSGRVILVGPVSDPVPELHAADIFALPSRHEGYGMAFAEALAHGLPIVACNAGAVPEVVPHDAGILAPVDDVDALARALATLLDDADRRRQIADAAWRAGQALPGWDDTARLVAGALARAAA